MSLDELEQDFRARQMASGAQLVIISMQIREDDVRWLRPRLESRGESLSEHVRKLIRQNVTWES